MYLVNITPREFILKDTPDELVTITGVGVGTSNENGVLFIVPIHIDADEVDPAKWGLEPTMRGFPKLRSNSDATLGTIVRISSFTEPGKSVGKIYVVPHNNLRIIGYGVGAMQNSRWEEVIVECRDETEFYVQPTSGPDYYLTVYPEGDIATVNTPMNESPNFSDFLKVSDQNLTRWKDHGKSIQTD